MTKDVSAFTPTGMLSLGSEMRAFALYGFYMGHFNLMETGLNTALNAALNVDGLSGTILARNISFADKIKSLKCLVSVGFCEAEQKKKYHSLLNRARKCGELRNVVAHTPFHASKITDGIEFYVVKANSELKFPEMDWSVNDIFSQVDEIRAVDNELREMEKQVPIQRIVRAIMNAPANAKSNQSGPLENLFRLGASTTDDDFST